MQLVDKCIFAHSGGKYGENLYSASGFQPTWQNAVDAWMGESPAYNPSSPDYTKSGHFTQVSVHARYAPVLTLSNHSQ